MFQSTRPREGAAGRLMYWSLAWPFQSTRPREGAGVDRDDAMIETLFQSTRPREGAARSMWIMRSWESVSIHAPPRGRGRLMPPGLHTGCQFQSTRPREGAVEQTFNGRSTDVFQSTRPREGAGCSEWACR